MPDFSILHAKRLQMTGNVFETSHVFVAESACRRLEKGCVLDGGEGLDEVQADIRVPSMGCACFQHINEDARLVHVYVAEDELG